MLDTFLKGTTQGSFQQNPFPKLCPAVALSHQDGRHSVVALLLKAALIQVSDYRLSTFLPLSLLSG
jgi:hypothetical protein